MNEELIQIGDYMMCARSLRPCLWQLNSLMVMQIEAIRSEMDIEINRLIAIIHKKNVDLTDLETKLVNRLRWGIVVLQSKNENLIRRQVLQWWRWELHCLALCPKLLPPATHLLLP